MMMIVSPLSVLIFIVSFNHQENIQRVHHYNCQFTDEGTKAPFIKFIAQVHISSRFSSGN